MNPASSTKAATNRPIVRGAVQEWSTVCTSAYTSTDMPAVARIAPSRSNERVAPSTLLSRRYTGAAAITARPTGTLMKKIHDQFSSWVRIPPSSTPAAPPEPAMAPQIPSALLRSGPSSNVVTRIASAAGETIAAPTPWIARAMIRDSSESANPHAAEASENSSKPAMKMRLRPSRSAARPPSSSRPPKVSV